MRGHLQDPAHAPFVFDEFGEVLLNVLVRLEHGDFESEHGLGRCFVDLGLFDFGERSTITNGGESLDHNGRVVDLISVHSQNGHFLVL